jgi:hypothetical protein
MSSQQRCAKAWLIAFDGEAADFWRELPDDSDFVGPVRDNINSFGPDEHGIGIENIIDL